MGAQNRNEDQLHLQVEWLDPRSEEKRHFLLTYYTRDNSVEMVS